MRKTKGRQETHPKGRKAGWATQVALFASDTVLRAIALMQRNSLRQIPVWKDRRHPVAVGFISRDELYSLWEKTPLASVSEVFRLRALHP